MKHVFPGEKWERKSPEELGMSSEKLGAVEARLKALAEGRTFQVAIARYGYVAAGWRQSVQADKQLPQASAAKSYYSSLLGIAVEEGKLPSAAAKAVDYYPEMMDMAEAAKLPRDELAQQITDILGEVLAQQKLQLNMFEQRDLVTVLINDMLGLGPIEPLLHDDDKIGRAHI